MPPIPASRSRLALGASVLGTLVLWLAFTAVAGAQGYPGGGAMGGGRGGPGAPGGHGGRGGPDAAGVEKRFTDLASLKEATRDIDGLSKAQKDSLKRIESHYHNQLAGYGKAARKMVEGAQGDANAGASSAPPDMSELRRLQADAMGVRREEFEAARAVLTSDAQRAKFDANLSSMRETEAKREAERRSRRMRPEGEEGQRGGPPAGGPRA